MSRVTATASVSVDPLQPMLCTVASDQVLEIIRDWNVLGFSGPEEVLSNWVGIIAEGDLDWAFKPMNVTVVASSLVCLMLFHQGDELLGTPALGLEVIVVGGRGTGVHHLSVSMRGVDARQHMGLTKLMLEPPPRILAHGTMAFRPESHFEGLE